MDNLVTDAARCRAAILADALAGFVAELRLVDPGDIIGYIRAEQWATIADLVQTAAELHLRDGVLSFACAADFALGWQSLPTIALELEIQTGPVTVFFTLFLDRDDGMVALRCVWFPIEPSSAAEGTATLAAALAEARRIHPSAPLLGSTS